MKSKRLFQMFVLLVMLFSTVGSSQPARAETADPIIINRELSFWDATYVGYVNDSLYEKWQFTFTATHTFTVTVTPVTGDLVPLLILLNGSGGEITRGTGTSPALNPRGIISFRFNPNRVRDFISSPSGKSIQVRHLSRPA